ncbi:MAG: DUF1499 domain-containing protein [Rhodohalobacter sp.]
MNKRKILLFGVFTVLLITAAMAVYFPLQGSQTSDIASDSQTHSEIEECPDSPNCIIVSKKFETELGQLFQFLEKAFVDLNPHEIEADSSEFKIQSVFKIPLFGFKDDVLAIVEKDGPNSLVHIKSSSRVGYSDLGVNRRRVKKIFRKLESYIIVLNN